MKSFYRVYNGQILEPGVNPFVRNLTLSPTSEIIDNWKFLQGEFDPDDDLEPDIEKSLNQLFGILSGFQLQKMVAEIIFALTQIHLKLECQDKFYTFNMIGEGVLLRQRIFLNSSKFI